MRRINIVTFMSLLIILFSSSVGVIASSEIYDVNSPEVKEIAEEFSMQGHENHDLATCATKIRYYEDIVELLNEGKSKEEILDYYYSMYGEQGLRAPKKEGFSLTAWLTPFLILGLGGTVLFIGLKKMINKQKDQLFDMEKEADVETEILTSVIDEERKKYF